MRNFETLLLVTALGLGNLISQASASPITLGAPPFLILQNLASNDIGQTTGESISVGDDEVVPNGSMGTTATAETTNLSTGATFSRTVPFKGSTALPNRFSTVIAYDPDLTRPWTLTFSNAVGTAGAPNIVSATTGSLAGVAPAPFASNVTVSGSSLNPTFTWTFPSGSINGVFFNIYDKNLTNAAGGVDIVYGTALTTNSFTIPTALAGGLTLDPTHNYTVEIQGVVLRNPTGFVDDANAAATSGAFFDFTPLPAGSPVVNLPSITPTGAYQYSMTVVAGTTYFVDPTVAVGYQFAIGAGDPNFASVLLPAVQSNPFDVSFVYNSVDFSDMVLPETVFDFPIGGVDAFTVTGIDPSDGLDPGDTTAFMTGLTFVGDGTFDGTQTPITEAVATPEPGSIALLASGLVGLLLFRRGRRSALDS